MEMFRDLKAATLTVVAALAAGLVLAPVRPAAAEGAEAGAVRLLCGFERDELLKRGYVENFVPFVWSIRKAGARFVRIPVTQPAEVEG